MFRDGVRQLAISKGGNEAREVLPLGDDSELVLGCHVALDDQEDRSSKG